MLEGEYLSHSVLSAATLQNAPIIIIMNQQFAYYTYSNKVFTNLRIHTCWDYNAGDDWKLEKR